MIVAVGGAYIALGAIVILALDWQLPRSQPHASTLAEPAPRSPGPERGGGAGSADPGRPDSHRDASRAGATRDRAAEHGRAGAPRRAAEREARSRALRDPAPARRGGTGRGLPGGHGAGARRCDGPGPGLSPSYGRTTTPVRSDRLVREHAPPAAGHRPHPHRQSGNARPAGRGARRRPPPGVVHTYHGHVLEGYFGPARSAFTVGSSAGWERVSDALDGREPGHRRRSRAAGGCRPRARFRVIPSASTSTPSWRRAPGAGATFAASRAPQTQIS